MGVTNVFKQLTSVCMFHGKINNVLRFVMLVEEAAMISN